MTKGRLYVISAPSGAGKTTVLRTVMAQIPGLGFSVSHTTRSPRKGERDGVDYHFVEHAEFEKMIAAKLFLEYAAVHTNLYGTSRNAVESLLSQGQDVVLDIDVQGALILRNQEIKDAVYIFIAPPSMQELERRLKGRGTETDEKIAVRLQNAMIEMKQAPVYDYLVVNDDLEDAIYLLSAIIHAERAKARRKPNGEPVEIIGMTGIEAV